jgi:hypothetical protein
VIRLAERYHIGWTSRGRVYLVGVAEYQPEGGKQVRAFLDHPSGSVDGSSKEILSVWL